MIHSCSACTQHVTALPSLYMNADKERAGCLCGHTKPTLLSLCTLLSSIETMEYLRLMYNLAKLGEPNYGGEEIHKTLYELIMKVLLSNIS